MQVQDLQATSLGQILSPKVTNIVRRKYLGSFGICGWIYILYSVERGVQQSFGFSVLPALADPEKSTQQLYYNIS